MKKRKLLAVAVRDGDNLFLVFTVHRSEAGDVYVNFPRDQDPDWKPHASYHASGQHHQKSHNHKMSMTPRQKPDRMFRGNHNIVTTGLSSDEPRKINAPYDPNEFDNLFEIPITDIRPEKYRTSLSFDLAEKSGGPTILPGAKILHQFKIADREPWILVTFFETPPVKTKSRQLSGKRLLRQQDRAWRKRKRGKARTNRTRLGEFSCGTPSEQVTTLDQRLTNDTPQPNRKTSSNVIECHVNR
jgi:hypothetical protein